MNHAFLQVFCAIFSGLLQGFAISNEILPFGSPLLGLFCLVPLYVALYRAKSYRGAFSIFALQTLTVHLFSSYWLYNFHGYALWSLGASAFGTALLGGLTGIVIFFIPRQMCFNRSKTELEEAGGKRVHLIPLRILWFAFSFVFWEWIKSTGFLAYPWGTLFMTAYKWKIMTQMADITGVWGITFLFALFNAIVAEGFNVLNMLIHSQNPSVPAFTYKKTAKATAILMILTAVYGIFQYLVPRSVKKELNAIIVQQNVDPWEGGDAASISISSRLTEREVSRMRSEGKEPDLVLWSEGALVYAFPSAIDYYSNEPEEESLTDFIKRMNVPFLIGGNTLTDKAHRKMSNSAILFDRRGEYAGFYSKIHLVPFGEIVPFMDNPLFKSFMTNVVGLSYTTTPGNQYVLFKVPLNSSSILSAPLRDGLEPYGTIELDASGRVDSDAAMKYIINLNENPESYVWFSTPICFEDAFNDVCRPLFNSGSEIFLNITNDSWSKTPSSEYQHFIVASFRAIEYRTTLVRCANAGYSVVVAPNGKILNDMAVFTEDALGCSIPIYEHKNTVYSILGDWFVYLTFIFMTLCFVIPCVVFYFNRIRKSPALLKFAEAVIKDNPEHEFPQEASYGEGLEDDEDSEVQEQEEIKDHMETSFSTETLSLHSNPAPTPSKTAARRTSTVRKASAVKEKKTTGRTSTTRKTTDTKKTSDAKKTSTSKKTVSAKRTAPAKKTAANKKTTPVKKTVTAKKTAVKAQDKDTKRGRK